MEFLLGLIFLSIINAFRRAWFITFAPLAVSIIAFITIRIANGAYQWPLLIWGLGASVAFGILIGIWVVLNNRGLN